MWRKLGKYAALLMLMVFPITLLSSCSSDSSSKQPITSLAQLKDDGRVIGVVGDTDDFRLVKENFPKAEIKIFDQEMSGFLSAQQGKIDAFVFDKMEMRAAMAHGVDGVKILDEDIGEPVPAGVAISPKTKIAGLKDKVNAFIDEIEANGTFDIIRDKWLVQQDFTLPEYPIVEQSDIHLTVGTTGINSPFSLYVNNQLAGHDVELAYHFAKYLNATIEFKVYDFSGIVAAATEGKIDCIFSNLFITPERKEAMEFSKPTYYGEIGAMVQDSSSKAVHVDELKNSRIGVVTSSNHPEHIKECLPDATQVPFSSFSDLVTALLSNKVDAIAVDEPVARSIKVQYPSVSQVPEILKSLDYAFFFTKAKPEGKDLCDEISAFVDGLRNDGTLAGLQKKWFDVDDVSTVEMLDYRSLPATKGTIDAVTIQDPPFSFSRTTDLYGGYDVEVLALFCQETGYALELHDVPIESALAGVIQGMDTVGCGGFTKTPEREESVYFSSPTYSGGTVLLTLDGSAAPEKGFFQFIAESFEKTFIREDRWKMFLEGIVTTLIITALSIVFGTTLGFGVFLLCRKGNKVANLIARFFVWLIQGMPVVVLLMILYYIVFSNSPISGEWVSIVGFTLVFGSGVFAMLKSGVATVEVGQTETAFALGYRESKAFFRIVLPQAIPHMLPVYKAEITSLIKATAIVGYVAVQDVTKIGDIIRSRTFEPFFPLITVAIIYFLLAALLIFIVNRVEF
ncbi:MAG: ABC transporter permease subunit, partial [Bacilli bacterium]|nr:ABC transporter permease subunit [Bacilli bacterium]